MQETLQRREAWVAQRRGGLGYVFYDLRRPPDFGRIPGSEDIFASVEVDGRGALVGQGGELPE